MPQVTIVIGRKGRWKRFFQDYRRKKGVCLPSIKGLPPLGLMHQLKALRPMAPNGPASLEIIIRD